MTIPKRHYIPSSVRVSLKFGTQNSSTQILDVSTFNTHTKASRQNSYAGKLGKSSIKTWEKYEQNFPPPPPLWEMQDLGKKGKKAPPPQISKNSQVLILDEKRSGLNEAKF